jgi:YHS domain-containing protein
MLDLAPLRRCACPALATALLLLFALGVAPPALHAEEPTGEAAPAPADPAPALQRVETKKVCMVNDAVFERDQIPVEVEGKTYFGCCEMCKKRLAEDLAVRQAVDPVSGKTVDKATAVIGALPDGKVLYLESAETFERYGKPE